MSLFKKETKEVKKKPAPAKSASMKDMYADSPATTKQEEASAVSRAYHVLVKPIISEKASRQQTVSNQYSFAVAIGANKIEIAKAVKAAFGIAPIKVNIVRVEGKSRRYGRTVGKRKDWKKAIVTLPAGKTIALHEGV